jgi:flagellar hook-basal body complex protein FliE
MAITPIAAPNPALAGIGVQPGQPTSVAGESFTKLIDQMLSHVRDKQTKADLAVNDLVMGRTDNLHNVMLSVSNAEMSLRMILEIRNRLTEAYQEIMRMQV